MMGAESPALDSLDWSDPSVALQSLGKFVDACFYLKDQAGLERALRIIDGLDTTGWSRGQRGFLLYVKSNIWSDLFSYEAKPKDGIPWESPHFQGQLLALKQAILSVEGNWHSAPWLIQAFTNLGNLLNHLGRPIEALESWNAALRIDAKFPMALGNRGLGFVAYSNALYDEGHRKVLLAGAHRDLAEAMKGAARLEPGARAAFRQTLRTVAVHLGNEPSGPLKVRTFPLGSSAAEQRYRRWCLDNRLFLNPLNDLDSWTVAARDIIGLPTLTATDFQPNEWIAVFNQVKQEFVSSRFLLYEGMTSTKPHFSDCEVLLVNTLDYPVHSLASEKVKASYRMSYSIFDRLALLLNDYLDLGFPEDKITFRSMWYDKGERKLGIHRKLKDRANWPLRGLFWLGKDLFEQREGFQDALLPDARELRDVRHHIEHKMLRLHQLGGEVRARDNLFPKRGSIGYSMDYGHFEDKALRLLKMVRGAILYTTMAIHTEEERKRDGRDPNERAMTMMTDVWEDRWKTPRL